MDEPMSFAISAAETINATIPLLYRSDRAGMQRHAAELEGGGAFIAQRLKRFFSPLNSGFICGS